MIYIGTILHYDSVLSRTLKNPLWRVARFKALIRWPDNMSLWDKWEEILRNNGADGEMLANAYYQQHRAEMDEGAIVSWSARPILALMLIRARDGHATFDAEYQNDPVSGEDAIFAGEGVFHFWVNRLAEWIFFGACDPSLGKQGASRDPSALLVEVALTVTPAFWICSRGRYPQTCFDKIISDIIELRRIIAACCGALKPCSFRVRCVPSSSSAPPLPVCRCQLVPLFPIPISCCVSVHCNRTW